MGVSANEQGAIAAGILEAADWYLNTRQNDKYMGGLTARARVNGKSGDWKSSVDDLTAAIALAPLRADLYRLRADARSSAGDAEGASADRKFAATLEDGNR